MTAASLISLSLRVAPKALRRGCRTIAEVVALRRTTSRVRVGGVITRGWADPQNHRSLEAGETLVPGRFYELTFDLQPDDLVIPAGSRIGLMIFSSDRDFTLWPEPGTELSVDRDGSWLEVPVVGGRR